MRSVLWFSLRTLSQTAFCSLTFRFQTFKIAFSFCENALKAFVLVLPNYKPKSRMQILLNYIYQVKISITLSILGRVTFSKKRNNFFPGFSHKSLLDDTVSDCSSSNKCPEQLFLRELLWFEVIVPSSYGTNSWKRFPVSVSLCLLLMYSIFYYGYVWFRQTAFVLWKWRIFIIGITALWTEVNSCLYAILMFSLSICSRSLSRR